MMAKGTIINGPDGMGYRVVRDIHAGEVITDSFEPIGGAPAPKPGDSLPYWLAKAIAYGGQT